MGRRVVVLVLWGVALAAPAAAHAGVQWLCHPGLASDPCRGDLTTTAFAPDGTSTVMPVDVPTAPPIDCFYVYPTVSNQLTTNATESADPEVQAIATFQAQRCSTRCRIFAPLYRQVTAAGVSVASQTHDATPYQEAYDDVRTAFDQYLVQLIL